MNQQELDEVVDYLRCAFCKHYLLYAPIVQLPDGNSSCGRCAPSLASFANGTMVRNLTLENILSKLTFPCKYKPSGCPERLTFGFPNHQESNCPYRPIPCPTGSCLWTGSMLHMSKHFSELHCSLVKDEIEFKLQVGQSAQDIILSTIENVPFMVTYVYNAREARISFDVKCLTLDKASYKIWMFNDSINEYGVSIKGDQCLPFLNAPTGNVLMLNLNKYLPVLENPKCILVGVEMMIEKGDDEEGSSSLFRFIPVLKCCRNS